MTATWQVTTAAPIRILLSSAYLFALVFSELCCAFQRDQYAITVSAATEKLTQRTVNRTYQDSTGFLWILTQEGAHRYDGETVTPFRASNSGDGAISHHFASDIVETDDDTLWIATLGGGLNRYSTRNQKFTAIHATQTSTTPGLQSDYISALYKSTNDLIYIGYADGSGVSVYNDEQGTLKHFRLTDPKPDHIVRAFAESPTGDVYVAVRGLGIGTLNHAESAVNVIRIDADESVLNEPTDLATYNNKLVITTINGGAWIYDIDLGKITRRLDAEKDESRASVDFYSVFVDDDRNYWLGTSAGLLVIGANGSRTWFTSFDSSLPSDHVTDIYKGQAGVIWIGTYNGLAKATPALFQLVTESDGLSSNSVNAILDIDENEWWIGTDRGISRLIVDEDKARGWRVRETRPALLKTRIVMSLARHKDLIYAGTRRSGLFIFDRKSLEVRQFSAEPSKMHETINHNGVTSILPLSDSIVAIGTYGGGLNLFNPDTGRFAYVRHSAGHTHSLSDDRVITLLRKDERSLWVGTQNGLNLVDLNSSRVNRYMESDSSGDYEGSSVILSLMKDELGTLWIGTRSSGIYKWSHTNLTKQTAQFEPPDANSRLPSADIYGLVQDGTSAVWATHNAGLTRADIAQKNARTFTVSNGLQGSEFNHGALHKTASGAIIAGGPNGINIIDPSQDYRDLYDPPVVITAVKVMNQKKYFSEPYHSLSEIQLNEQSQLLTLDFASLDFRDPAQTRYRYRISGLQGGWISLEESRSISIYGLSHGVYTVEIQGSNASGAWSDNPIELALNVPPPWWLQPYAYVVYSLAVALSGCFAYLRHRRNVAIETERRVELEQRVQQRTIDLQKARADAEIAAQAKADFLASMSHELRTPIHGMIGVSEVLLQSNLSRAQSSLLQSAVNSGKALLDLINSILDYSRLESGKIEIEENSFSVVKLIDEVVLLLYDKASRKSLHLYTRWMGEIPEVIVSDQGKIRQIVMNLVGNAIKFTDSGKVLVQTSCVEDVRTEPPNASGHVLRVEVHDTGIGIHADEQEQIFGLFNQVDTSATRDFGGTGLGLAISRDLASLLGGSIEVTSKFGTGSTFTFSIPVAEAKFTRSSERKHIGFASKDDPLGVSIKSKLRVIGYEAHFVCLQDVFGGSSSADCVVARESEILETDLQKLRNHRCARIVVIQDTPSASTPISSTIELVPPPYTCEMLLGALRIDKAPPTTSEPPCRTVLDASRPVRALIAEDVELNQRIVVAMLHQAGIESDVVDNGAEAVRRASEREYDILFMDCQMPGMDGFRATREIRAHEAQTGQPRTPIIALSAAVDSQKEQEAAESGMDLIIQKPFSTKLINDVVEGVVQEKRKITEQCRHADTLSSIGDNADVLDESVMRSFDVLANDANAINPSELATAFTEQLNTKLALLGELSDTKCSGFIANNAHAIKSMSASIGAARIREAASALENNADNVSHDQLKRFLDFVVTECDVFAHAFQRRIHPS